jgi:hypothetical protein
MTLAELITKLQELRQNQNVIMVMIHLEDGISVIGKRGQSVIMKPDGPQEI